MKLTPQQTYIRDKNSTSAIYHYDENETHPLSPIGEKYILSKEELIELLDKAFQSGSDFKNMEWVNNQIPKAEFETRTKYPTKEQFINNLFI